jgi:parvulin-like peptidyl-prolyl isomerase
MVDVAVRVNGVPISATDLQTTMQSLASEQFKARLEDVPDEARVDLREMALSRLIARELLYQEALKEGIVATVDDIEAEQNRILRQMGHPRDFWDRLQAAGMDQASFMRMLRKDVTVDRMTARKLTEVADPDEQAIRAFFREHAEKLQSAPQVRVRHILLPVDPGQPEAAEALARELLATARPANFAELASQHSSCPTAAGGGDLGYVRREDLDPTFADAAFQMPVGEVGGPVRTPFGYHLLLVEDRRSPAPLTLEEARPNIIKYCRREDGSRLLDAWVQTLRRRAAIEIAPAG